jgi:hypothetical protein
MSALRCYRCGTSLAKLTLPLSRRDQCPSCRVDLRVCLMCKLYAPQQLPDQCLEEDAADVRDKAQANFCDFFVPNDAAFVSGRMTAQRRAEAQLESLFGGTDADPQSDAPDDARSAADALFKD